MTFTDTACDCAESLPIEIVRLKQIEGIEDVKAEVTWSPAWKITRISRYGRIALYFHHDDTIPFKKRSQLIRKSFFEIQSIRKLRNNSTLLSELFLFL